MTDETRDTDSYYIFVPSQVGDDHTRVLKHADTFGVFDRSGDILPVGRREHGVYRHGTRVLSRMSLAMTDGLPMVLGSTVVDGNDMLVVHLTNPDLYVRAGGDAPARHLPRGSLHVLRALLLWRGVLYERLRITNHDLAPVDIDFDVAYGADYADIFEVRGARRPARGQDLAPQVAAAEVVLGYLGLDRVVRRTRIAFAPAPAAIDGRHARLRLHLEPHAAVEQLITVVPAIGDERLVATDFDQGVADNAAALQAMQANVCRAAGINEHFNNWVNRSITDLCLLSLDTADGPYPAAGVPWFSTVFGRDGIITAFECLWAWPELARGVLAHLAATQADAVEAARDAEPGKILHESRSGEMAALGEIPFGRYYGSVDATPLFVMLAGAYFQRTHDLEFARALWPHVDRALRWMDEYGDMDGDGFVEYQRRSADGLGNHGWKDSSDSVFHAGGELARAPIALCEVQGYTYAARLHAAELARQLGDAARAEALRRQADRLRDEFDRRFWLEDLGTYALALDADKRPCRVRTSNAGHCLWSGIARAERAPALARTLLSDEMFSGWGVRTVAASEARYNPMSYHNGSVWPHDNAIVAHGLAAYGFAAEALAIFEGMFAAGTHVDLHRMPELFCGFRRRAAEGPTRYPVACSPQAWAAGAVLLLLQSILGLSFDGAGREIRLVRPALPASLPWLELHGLRLLGGSADLRLERFPDDVSVRVLSRRGGVHVSMIK